MSIRDKNFKFCDKEVVVPAHTHFGKFLLEHMRLYKNNVALENGETDEKLTYGEFIQYSVNLAMALKDLGITPGDVVAIGSERRLHFLPTELAVTFIGATITPYDPLIGSAVLTHDLGIAKPKYFITSKLFWNNYKDILKNSEFIKSFLTFEIELESVLPLHKIMPNENVDVDLFEPVAVKGQNDVALILYSSGTTGMPKGVLLSHLNCILNSDPSCFKDPELQTCLVFAEWYHNYCRFMTYKFLLMGKKIVYINTVLSFEIFPKVIEKCKVNIKMSIPATIAYLAKTEGLEKYDLSSLKVLYSRSSPLHAKTMELVKKRFPCIRSIMQGYGMTEAGELTSEVWGTKGTRLGSVGMPTPGLTFKIADLTTGKPLGPNENGEIRIRGPPLMLGYIGVESSTYLDEEGFLKTGDLGYYDKDGYFYIIDRIKEILNVGGFQVAPLELETVLLLHPDVKEAGVVGKPVEDLVEFPAAFVVKQPGSSVTEQELIDFVAGQVSYYMWLRGGVIFIDKLPRNQRGKILRRTLKEMLKDTYPNETKLTYLLNEIKTTD